MKAKILLLCLLLIPLILSSGCTDMGMGGVGTFVRAPRCSWVFRTRDDYSGLVSVSLVKDRSRANLVPFFDSPVTGLGQGYYTASGPCEYPDELIIAFTSVTVEEWEQSQEECMEKRAEYHDTSVTKTRRTDPDTGSGLQPMAIGNLPCDSDLLMEILEDPDPYIQEYDPFTELYICDLPGEDLNRVISGGELGSRCERYI